MREEAKIAVVNADHEVSFTLPNFTCSINSTISLGCSPSFVICAGNTAYVFNCDGDLVFDQAKYLIIKFLLFLFVYCGDFCLITSSEEEVKGKDLQMVSSCNRIEDTPECDEQDGKQRMLSVTSGFSSSSPLTEFGEIFS